MKKGLTELVFILDRSGSMYYFIDDTIGGFNSMIEKYKQELEEAYITTVLFDDRYQILHNHINLKEINPITRKEYYTDGSTALYDALGRTINSVGERLFNTPEEERPEKVIFVINTDGYENASREFTRSKVKEMIEHQQTKYSWGFLFLGANIDAEKEAENIGINRNFAATYAATSDGLTSSYDAASDAVMFMAACDSISEYACEAKAILDSKVVSGKTDISSKTYCDIAALDEAISYVDTIPLEATPLTGEINLAITDSAIANVSGLSSKEDTVTLAYNDFNNYLASAVSDAAGYAIDDSVIVSLETIESKGLSSVNGRISFTDEEIKDLFGTANE